MDEVDKIELKYSREIISEIEKYFRKNKDIQGLVLIESIDIKRRDEIAELYSA